MEDQVFKKQQAAEDFAFYLSEDTSILAHDWQREISAALKDFAFKYNELSPAGADGSQEWHDYFLMGLKKFVRELPSTITDLDNALDALNREEVAAEARARGVHIQILPEPPAPAPVDEGNDKTPKAPAPLQNGNHNANGKRPAENQADMEAKVPSATEAQDRPAKRVKHDEAEDAATSRGTSSFTLETEGSLTFRISDDARTSTFNLNGRGPAVVTVNVQKKATTALASTAPASANGNKEAKKEGAA